ncbi:MAG: metal-dependent hydrolase [Candidatus Lindowbacteria bacterium]|nr:metal-dependent hydrolase [Candidatus Lindowbacteria bacterium]
MDNLTHSLIGFTMAKAGLEKKCGKGTVAALVIASSLPDIDFLYAIPQPDQAWMYRRMLTHSLVGMPLLALLAAFVFSKFSPNISYWKRFGLYFLGIVVHVFFDAVNSYGVVFLYPFVMTRYELSWVFVVDLFIWAILLYPFGAWIAKWPESSVEPAARAALVLVGIYVAVCGYGSVQTSRLIDERMEEEGRSPEYRYAFPEVLGGHRFRGIVREGDIYSTYLVNWIDGSILPGDTFVSMLSDPAVERFWETEDGENIAWFFEAPVFRVAADKSMIEVNDLRFKSIVMSYHRNPFEYTYPYPEAKDYAE